MKAEHVQPNRKLIAGPRIRRAYERLRTWIDLHPTQALMLIVLVALVMGMVKLRLDPPNLRWDLDNRWWQIALNVARGDGYVACKPIYFPFCGPTNQVTAMREPLPVLFFALIAQLTKESLLVAAAAEVIINIAILLVVFCLTRELANTGTALLGALLWAMYLPPIQLFYSQVSGDLLATLSVACGLVYVLRARRTDRRRDWLLAGGWIGIGILSRSAVIIVALALTIGLAVWPYVDSATPKRFLIRRLRPFALFAIAWALVLSPWFARNYVAFGRPVLGSTLSGYYLYRQNYMLSTDNYLRFVTGGEFLAVLKEKLAQRADLQGTENEAQMDLVYREEAQRIIAAEPLHYMILSGYRFFMLWFNWGVKEAYGDHNRLLDHLVKLQHVLLLGAGVVGLRGRWRRAWPLALSVTAFSLLYMAVQAHLPYIIPVMPLLVALSAAACTQVGQQLYTMLSRTA